MENLSLVRTELLTVLISLVEVLWCRAGIDTMPSCILLIKYSYDFIDVIYQSDLGSSAFSSVKCNTEVVVNLALVDSNLY